MRESFLRRKLGLSLTDDELDGVIAEIGETMKDNRSKNRVTVYYLLADRFGKLTDFA